MKVLVAILGGVGLIAAFLAISYYAGIFGNNMQANYQGRVVTAQVEQRVRTPEFAQSTYEQFFHDCNAILANNAQIVAAQARIAAIKAAPDDTFGQKASRLADAITDLAGLQQAQAMTAADYNANAAEFTRRQFLDASLPAHIDPPYSTLTCQ